MQTKNAYRTYESDLAGTSRENNRPGKHAKYQT